MSKLLAFKLYACINVVFFLLSTSQYSFPSYDKRAACIWSLVKNTIFHNLVLLAIIIVLVYEIFQIPPPYPLVKMTTGAPPLILATSSLHPFLFSVLLKLLLSVFLVHSVMFSSYLFLCLPLFRPPCTVFL